MQGTPFEQFLNEDQAMIAEAVRDFSKQAVLPNHEHLDHSGEWPVELWSQIAELGLLGSFVSEEMGGTGAGFLAHAVAVETLAEGAGLAGALLASQGIVVDAIVRSGHAQTGDWLAGLISGEVLGAPAMLEEVPGLVQCVASGDGAHLTLSGAKMLVPGPGRAGLYVVRAQGASGPLLALVEASASGLRHELGEANLGLCGFETGTLHLDQTPALLLGGAALVAGVETGARIAMAALLLGISQGGLNHAVRYSHERKQFNMELHRFGAMQERLARSDARTEALRGLVRGAAARLDQGEDATLSALRARQFAAEIAPLCADDAVQIYGGYGFSREYPAERFYRDAMFPGFGEYHFATVIAQSVELIS
jgi:alkylation response protein AidB-like acyl-CoA dehydrogenase